MVELSNEVYPAYPVCILPQKTYVDLIEEKVLCSKKNGLIIQRRAADNVNIDIITPEIFGDNLKGMSVNLLGGEFLPKFVKFTPIGAKNFPCEEPFDGNYKFYAAAFGVYLQIASIHNQTFPSPRKFPNSGEYNKVKGAIRTPKDRLLAAFDKSKSNFSKDREYEVIYIIRVMHRPTNANYWHCQIEISPDCEEGKTVDKDKSEWQKRALRSLTNFLVPYTSLAYPNPLPTVNPQWYIKEPA